MKTIWKYFVKIIVGIWDAVFYIVGAPYEQQAKKLDAEKVDPLFRGPENPKTDHKAYRANKVSN